MKRVWSKKEKIRNIIFIGVLAAVIAAILCVGLYQSYQKQITPVLNPPLQMETGDTLPKAEAYFSYLGAFDPETATVRYQDKDGKTVEPVDRNDCLTLPVGSYIVTLTDSFVEKPFEANLEVNDTKSPSLTLKEITVEHGETYSEDDFIESCRDNSGEVALLFTVLQDDGTESVLPTTDEPGQYKITVTATDPSGNRTTAETLLTVKEKPVPPAPSNPVVASKTPYSIAINRVQNTVTVYTLDEADEYTVPHKVFVCSTGGDKTPTGNFKLGARYPWLSLFGGVYGQYTIRIHGSIAFHSVPYYTQNKADLEYEEYNKLGSVASAGCVRLCVRDVKWIYDNCETGTPVSIFDADDPGPLGKPASITIDPAHPNRGWDPTDPDPANPWNQS